MFYNTVLAKAYFPKVWRRAAIVILHKPNKSDYSRVESYRPIALLPVLGKVFERLINSRLSFLAVNRKGINDFQFGFRPFHSASDAVLDYVENVKQSWRDSRILSALALDLEGAYDNILHEPFVNELTRFNCPSDLLQILVHFLSSRTFYTTDRVHKSNIFYSKKVSHKDPRFHRCCSRFI